MDARLSPAMTCAAAYRILDPALTLSLFSWFQRVSGASSLAKFWIGVFSITLLSTGAAGVFSPVTVPVNSSSC